MHDWMEVLPNQIWVHSPTQSEATPLTPGFGEVQCLLQGAKQECERQALDPLQLGL